MFRLPVCPHCGTVYRYKETREAIRKKENICYHCQKKFKVRIFPTVLSAAILPLILCIALNIFLLTRMENLQLIPLFIATMLFILLVFIIIPFFTIFKKIEDESDKKEKKK